MDTNKRANSVRRIKRIIVCTILIGILLPNILCIALFARIHGMQRTIDDLKEARLAQEVEFALMMDTTGNSVEGYIVEREEVPAVSEDEEGIDGEPSGEVVKDEIVCPEELLPEGTRKVYLTFDDGPSSMTDDILDILDTYGIKATFFVVAKQEEQFLPLYQRIVDEGHSLGMHSYSHKYSEIYASMDAFENDIESIQDFLYKITGKKVSLYRFPGGSSNTVSRVSIDKLIGYLNKEQITFFDWNISSKDATSSYISAEQIVSNCMQNLKEYDTCVILMHDAQDKKSTVEALPMLIERIQAMENTVILPITDGTDLVQHRKGSLVEE